VLLFGCNQFTVIIVAAEFAILLLLLTVIL